jgi:hypothetical protein
MLHSLLLYQPITENAVAVSASLGHRGFYGFVKGFILNGVQQELKTKIND